MLHTIDILALSGSLRAASTNSALLAALQRNAPPDCRLTIYEGLGHLPIFNPDDEGERTPPQQHPSSMPSREPTASSSHVRNTRMACRAA